MTTRLTRAGILKSARNLFFAGTGAASALLLLVLLVAAGRTLGEADYGRFSFALALATILEVLMDFGLKEVVTRNVARDRSVASHLVSHVFGVKLLLSTGGLATITTLAFLLRPEPDVRLACVLLGLSAVLRSYLLTARHLLNGLERFGLDSVVLVSDRLLLLVLGLAALGAGYGVLGLSVAFVAGRAAAFAIAYAIARSQVGPLNVGVDRTQWRMLIRAAAPFGLFIAVLNLYSYVDTVMLGVMRTDAETGLYSAAYRVYEGIVSLASIMGTVAGPQLARQFVTNRARHAWLARYAVGGALVAAVPIAIGTLFTAPWLLAMLFGTGFGAGAGVLRILAVGLVCVFPLQVMHAVAISVNEERVLIRAATAGCIVKVVFNTVLIPTWGIAGAALSTVASETASFAVILLRVRGSVPPGPVVNDAEGLPS